MATITPTAITDGATEVPLVAATSGGDAIVNTSGNAVLVVSNASGGSINVTINVPANTKFPTVAGFPPQTLANQVRAIPAGTTRYIQLYPKYNDTNGQVQLTYSSVTSLTVGALTS